VRHLIIVLIITLLWPPYTFGLDAKISIETTIRAVVEGQLSQVSKLPPAKDNPYPDCYYTSVIEISQIVSGQSVPKRVALVLPGFFSREYAPEAHYKTGDKVRATIVPSASMPDKVRQTQQADEIEDVDLDFFFPEQISLIQEFQAIKSPVPFADKNQKAIELPNLLPIDLDARAARQETMRHDLEEIDRLLAKYGGDWDKWYNSLSSFRAKYKGQFEAKAQRWIGDSFFSAGQIDDGKIYSPDFIKSVIAFKNYLAARNIDLILVRVPKKGEVVDDLFATSPPDQVFNPYLLRMYKELLEADVEVITNVISEAKEDRLKYPLMYWYQDFSEVHPAEGISWVIAKEFAKRVNRYDRVRAAPKKAFALKEVTKGIKWPDGHSKFSSRDDIPFLGVMDNSGRPLQLKQATGSPVLIVGSSFITFPSLGQGASIPHYFANVTGLIPDILQRNGSDLVVQRNIAREGNDFIRNRSVCLFPFVPWIAYKSLAPLPLFDPDNSDKTLLASYSGPPMREAISFSPMTVNGALSYSPDGLLQILPVIKGRGASGTFSVRIPDTVTEFPYFICEVEFTSNDLTEITAKYSSQSDFIVRSDTKMKREEVFVFSTQSSKALDLNFAGNNVVTRPITIKSIKFYGVKQPNSF